MDVYDYILVGGGSSACVAASRLVTAGAKVLMLERGPRRANPIMHFPAGYMKFLARDTYLMMHETEPQAQLDGRAPTVPQGRVLGGGGTVNAMVYMRGQREDYADWNRAIGGNGTGDWDWDDLLAYYTGQEDNDHLGGPLHGVGGPLKISHLGHTSPMTRAWLKTMQGMGIPYTPDFNDGDPRGVGLMQHTMDWTGRRRCSPVDAFLAPVMDRPNLKVITGATVEKVILEGKRAVGVSWKQAGQVYPARAGEVLLAAGAYQTPKLLMLSGIGPEAELRRHGIAVDVRLEGVGANLQDHYECPVVATTNGAYGYYGQDKGLKMILAGLQYLLFKSGPATTTGVESCAFLDPKGAGGRPTVQMFCVPTVYLDRDVTGKDPGHGVTINSLLLQPKSRGSVRLRSRNPEALPVVDPQIFADQRDLETTIAGLRFARRVLEETPMKELIETEIFPGIDVTSDAALGAHCRRTVKTGYHPVGTCRMGAEDDPLAVLDPSLRVRGTEGLRVIDASMMPNIVSGNTNAAAMAVGDKAATLILGSQR
ncbi:GMC family oxidoreductase N-terminal domain-containing protein [Chelativorans sp. AA-79]|uniref:GMC family oxidoreductase n=1 Tax=Chelativorans sp. AA-79 TaxID=3028735 RepID=UPI0023F97162|nr:GMC family oxidoreductase N-terminal domain-containing protein [Chelativorans sp. AA-79]WEX08997.1 GMC family oxidoreductase N-terminal domain-containing protein [Chelativorans sp. AA-79]